MYRYSYTYIVYVCIHRYTYIDIFVILYIYMSAYICLYMHRDIYVVI